MQMHGDRYRNIHNVILRVIPPACQVKVVCLESGRGVERTQWSFPALWIISKKRQVCVIWTWSHVFTFMVVSLNLKLPQYRLFWFLFVIVNQNQLFSLIQLQLLLSNTGDTDLKMIPRQTIMIIYPDTWRATLLKISVTAAPQPISLRGHDKVDSSINLQQLHLEGYYAAFTFSFTLFPPFFTRWCMLIRRLRQFYWWSSKKIRNVPTNGIALDNMLFSHSKNFLLRYLNFTLVFIVS